MGTLEKFHLRKPRPGDSPLRVKLGKILGGDSGNTASCIAFFPPDIFPAGLVREAGLCGRHPQCFVH